jgi:hypothetical protein
VKLSTYLIGVPAVVVAAVVAVANRQHVIFSLDPFSQAAPVFAIRVPLFVLLFLALVLGILLGGMASMVARKPPPDDPPQAPKTSLLPGRRQSSKNPPR